MTTKLREAPGPPLAGRMAVDPRIRRRRVEITRAEGRRRLRILLGFAIVVVLMAAGWGISRSPFLDVDRVTVSGSVHTPQRALIAASGVRTSLAMADIDEESAARRLARLPWVASATVRRQWPSSITIEVLERVPVAAVELGGDRWALVDESARVLELVGERSTEVVTILGLTAVGPAGSVLADPGPAMLAVAREVPAALRDRLAGVATATTPDGGVELVLEGGARLRVGTPERLTEKFRAALTVLSRVNTSGMEILDVRVPDAPVLTRRPSEG